jgi:predicted RNase H-like nuclease (RuvC/YqgF family)
MGLLRNEIAQLRNESSQLRNEGSQLRNNISQLNEELAKVKADAAAQLALEVEKRDQRIKQLNTELERLIRIDADRRRRP